MKVLILLSAMFLTTGASAQDFEAFQPLEWQNSLIQPEAETYGPLSCADVAAELREFRQGLNEVIRMSVRAHYDVANVVSSWYGQLRGWEGRTLNIRYGTFDTMRQSARTAAENADFLESQFYNCDERFIDLLAMVDACL